MNRSLQTPGADRGSGVADRERPPGEGIDRDGDRGLALGECEIARQRIARGCHRQGRLDPSGHVGRMGEQAIWTGSPTRCR